MTVHSASRPHGIAEIDRSRPEEILPLLTRLYPAIPAETIAARLARVAAGDWRCLVMREAGQIVALSGSGRNRRATVQFAAAGERRFVLAHSPLRPAGR